MERLRSLSYSMLTALAVMAMVVGAVAAPSVNITHPRHGDVVSGDIDITVAFSSNSDKPIVRLDLFIDGRAERKWDLVSPRLKGVQSLNWDFSFSSGSKHTITVKAIDSAGEAGSAEIIVTTARADAGPGRDRVPPVISIYYPAQGAHVSGEIEVRAEATDNVGVKWVNFYVDGQFHTMIGNAPPHVASWDTTKSGDGPHVLMAEAWDASDNVARSAEVTVFVENHAMTSAGAGALTPPTTTASDTTIAGPPPQILEPQEGAGAQPALTRTQFGIGESSAMSASRQVQRAESVVSLSTVGYVPAATNSSDRPRTSAPRTMLAALPRTQLPPGPAEESLPGSAALPRHTAEACLEFDGTMHAALDVQPRVTTPRQLTPMLMRSAVSTEVGRRTVGPVGPEIAALGMAPRITVPRSGLESSLIAGVANTDADGWARLSPALAITPDSYSAPAQRTTAPAVAKEVLPEPPVLSAALAAQADAIMVKMPDSEGLGSTVAHFEQRTTRPALLEGAKAGEEVAVLPAAAADAGIPADRRLSTASGAEIAPVAATPFEDIQIVFDDEVLQLRAQPELKDGISIAPLREIFEHTDGVLYWFPIQKKVWAANADISVRLQIGDPTLYVNRQARQVQVAPYIKRGRTMVPLQFIADTLDVTVTVNPDSGQIRITSNKF